MKKNIGILIMLIILINNNAIAQSATHTVSYFIVDEKYYLDINNAVPMSMLDFYSHSGGGSYLFSHKANEKGEAKFTLSNTTMPAFCSSNLFINESIAKGTGKVTHFENYEFNFSAFNYSIYSNYSQLKWQAIVPENKNVFFEILASNDGKYFKEINVIQAHNNNIAQFYSYDINGNNKFPMYKINIYAGNQLKYSTHTIFIKRENTFITYPTLASNQIYIQNNENIPDRNYAILNSIGQVITSGIVDINMTSVDISSLAKGSYWIHISNTSDVLQFVKE